MNSETHIIHTLFGMNPMWLATAIFIATYAVIISERINRAIVALLGGGLMILCGILTQEAAIHGIDFNTLGLLIGMMVIVSITKKSGVFQFVAIWIAKKVEARPVGILVMMSLVTATFSALLDNVTTVLLVTPVLLLITEELKIKPYPFLFAVIFMSNIGGTATLIGDPPNIMIGSAAGLTFNDFLLHLTPIIPLISLATLLPIWWYWRKDMVALPEDRARVMRFNEIEAITDWKLLKQASLVFALVIAGFMLHGVLHIEPATTAMFGAATLLLLENFGSDPETQTKRVHHALTEVEWITLFFFIGLFIAVYGIEQAGLIAAMAHGLLSFTGGDLTTTALSILWGSAIASAFVDNIPFVATMIPLIKSMAPAMGGEQAIMPLWWALSLGACLGGNGTLVGASANLVVAGIAEHAGAPIRFATFLKVAFPLMLLSILISHAYLYFRYLM
ncbi:putative transporter [Ferriphaselus amnicola]|uniref:Putative transporter n=1 Tax=Ferriphaselus amnicola TaxID=1188319 RepID=A0A2Z6GB57_9PROT|nr:ArsB/NhaD family transporter [Ferriphaselus amnicola]BBE50743.1 putative transporter [Ferriphaselus amnicola]